jgi:hypothetical protein
MLTVTNCDNILDNIFILWEKQYMLKDKMKHVHLMPLIL